MDNQNEQEQKEKFAKILNKLASNESLFRNQASLKEIYNELEELYCQPNTNKRFRHYYSDIFAILVEINKNDNPGNLAILCQNVSILKDNYKKSENADIENEIRKLYDHINLEYARITYAEAGYRQSTSEEAIQNLRGQITEVKNKIDSTSKEQEEVSQKLETQQKEYITILGIFASIVLAFVGGITFSSSVLENINSGSIYRIVIVALIIGLVFINLIYILIDLIKSINSIKTNKPAAFWFANAILIIGILITVFAYKYCLFERNALTMNETINGVEIVQETDVE